MDITYISGRSEVLLCVGESYINGQNVYKLVSELEGLKEQDFYLTCNGRILSFEDGFSSPCTIRSNARLLGGKGGFGSMLRAIGARIEKTTNHEACRDLSGRRMRDVNNEKQITEWLKDKEDKDNERAKKRQEKLERIINPKYSYEDKDYTSNLQQNADNIDEALKQALKNHKDKSGDKRKADDIGEKNGKKSKISWMGLDDEDMEDDSDDEKITSEKPLDAKLHTNSEEALGAAEKNIDKEPIENESKSLENDSALKSASTQMKDSLQDTHSNDKEPIEPVMKPPSMQVKDLSEDMHSNTAEIKTKTTQADILNVQPTQPEALDLAEYNSPEQLEAVGLDRLKSALLFLGLKCGGTLQDRSQRLYLTKHTPIDKLDPSLFSKNSKKKKKKIKGK